MGGEICDNSIDDDGDNKIDCADSECASAAICSALVINEVDYDQPGTDAAEFIELFNAGNKPVTLDGLVVHMIRGEDNSSYANIALSGSLPAGGYAVLAPPGLPGIDPAAMVFDLPSLTSNLENGGGGLPDGIALYDTSTHKLIDAISYEGSLSAAMIDGMVFDLVSGNPAIAEDDSSGVFSIARIPNGADTGDDATDWVTTSVLTPGAANTMPEICDNGVDDNMNGAVDCADVLCDGAACDDSGRSCQGGVCTCPGGMTETMCGNGMDDDCDGAIDCADSDCSAVPACTVAHVTSVDYPVIAHGGTLSVTGTGFTGATTVKIGGVSLPFAVVSDMAITITQVLDAVPIGSQSLVVTTPSGALPAFPVTVIHLVLNEIDPDQSGNDTGEFFEVSAGVANVSLSGYSVILWNGDGNPKDRCYAAHDLSASTDANGLLTVGADVLVPLPNITWTGSDKIQNGPDAAGVYQAAASVCVVGQTLVSAVGLLDVVLHNKGATQDAELMAALLPGGVGINEDTGGMAGTNSIQRCGGARLDGTKFALGAPSPGAVANPAVIIPCP
jgi:hypothetical protein